MRGLYCEDWSLSTLEVERGLRALEGVRIHDALRHAGLAQCG